MTKTSRRVLVVFVAIISLSVLPSAFADDETLWLTTGEWSRHDHNQYCPPPEGSPCRDKYRQNNTGIGLQYDLNPDLSIVAGWYKNSVHTDTVYLGETYAPLHLGNAKFGIMGSIATGYFYVPVPIASLYASYESDQFGVNVFWLPDVVVGVQLKMKIK